MDPFRRFTVFAGVLSVLLFSVACSDDTTVSQNQQVNVFGPSSPCNNGCGATPTPPPPPPCGGGCNATPVPNPGGPNPGPGPTPVPTPVPTPYPTPTPGPTPTPVPTPTPTPPPSCDPYLVPHFVSPADHSTISGSVRVECDVNPLSQVCPGNHMAYGVCQEGQSCPPWTADLGGGTVTHQSQVWSNWNTNNNQGGQRYELFCVFYTPQNTNSDQISVNVGAHASSLEYQVLADGTHHFVRAHRYVTGPDGRFYREY